MALVSDAGTPGISDPGEEIVRKAVVNNIDIITIPGACALVSGLIASGIDTKEFMFIGFLPTNKKEKREKLGEIKNIKQTLILYEAPHKLKENLALLYEVLGNRNITLAREITKIHEEYIRGNILEIINVHEEPKGEYVIIIEGAKNSISEEILIFLNRLTLEEHYKFYEDKGYEKKQIIKQISKDRNVNKNEIYQYFIK
jgi:16S rRNA (cytidine1402-2'-O)-methyltransferase